MAASPIRVEAFRSLESVARLRGAIDALNVASRRPCPYATLEYIETFLAHDEHRRPDDEVLFLTAFDGAQLVGYLPLRRRRDRVFGIPFGRIELLVSHDTDRPHVVARRVDEPRCAEAFYRHLLGVERGWSVVELGFQDAESELNTVPSLHPLRFYARYFDNMPNTTLPLAPRSSDDYLRSLGRSYRQESARRFRHLLAEGEVELVIGRDPRARLPLLELYLDLERRSWKEAAHAGIRRDPRRVDLFRALTAPTQPLAIEIHTLLFDGLPIAGLINGVFCNTLYALETAFDRDYEDFGPGVRMFILAAQYGIEAGYQGFNLDGNYSYFKARLGGHVTPTRAIQIYRVGSVPWFKARAGDLKRRLRPSQEQAPEFNPERRRVARAGDEAPQKEDAPVRPPRDEERSRAKATLDALVARGVPFERISAAELQHVLSFSNRKVAA